MNKDVEELIKRQLSDWDLAKESYAAFNNGVIRYRTVNVDGVDVRIQHNPARIRSTAADISPAVIAARKCFLCRDNRPEQQEHLRWGNYHILVNPYPVFKKHLVICSIDHKPQSILTSVTDLYGILDYLSDAVVFYNGPKSGASAPEHLHFQACPKGELPLEINWKSLPKTRYSMDAISSKADVFVLLQYLAGAVMVVSEAAEDSVLAIRILMDNLPVDLNAPESEPKINLLSWKDDGKFVTVMIPRVKHRPDNFSQFMVAPACVELGGIIITPREEDFNTLTGPDVEHILKDVCLPFRQPQVKVGLLSAQSLTIDFCSNFRFHERNVIGPETFSYQEGKVIWRGQSYDRLDFVPVDEKNGCFSLMVKIGIAFHWERAERQMFQGGITILPVFDSVAGPADIIGPGAPGMLTVINRIGMEDYLVSVISSEMNSAAPSEFLRAHAIISRSWLMSKINGTRHSCPPESDSDGSDIVRWYDQEDHSLFDVCADDHCQRYQGIARVRSKKITEVINDTWGMVLCHNGAICDARYSKCCGGVSEEFENCWQEEHYDYLSAVRDSEEGGISGNQQIPDVSDEERAREWIMSEPASFCSNVDASILSTVLNNYDQETTDFYRWKVSYTQSELSELVKAKSGIDFGVIREIIPLQRGKSGRICLMKIVGSLRTVTVGKELEIRRWFSRTHLYSSAFVVDKTVKGDEEIFTFTGAGWGHGVGLCQIGAAVMGTKGYTYKQILLHYFRGAEIEKLY
ncbi:MAG: DUF4922 domain-containing protein [Alistipes sp.]|nr:DUF4922 domain-containing protein [Candidatus Minthomonas equi]